MDLRKYSEFMVPNLHLESAPNRSISGHLFTLSPCLLFLFPSSHAPLFLALIFIDLHSLAKKKATTNIVLQWNLRCRIHISKPHQNLPHLAGSLLFLHDFFFYFLRSMLPLFLAFFSIDIHSLAKKKATTNIVLQWICENTLNLQCRIRISNPHQNLPHLIVSLLLSHDYFFSLFPVSHTPPLLLFLLRRPPQLGREESACQYCITID
ncbi:hypothetical protein GDO81_016476 [Engystomops pustulosus]|uniref:Uncharacterized protein n=1 Tax=Engystomops pustulosus TaxID=76066 RepID=A0AAV7AYG4_ENGPU|nr:hypothetical protein GDO81_016476 [Engystomops pustulosus]